MLELLVLNGRSRVSFVAVTRKVQSLWHMVRVRKFTKLFKHSKAETLFQKCKLENVSNQTDCIACSPNEVSTCRSCSEDKQPSSGEARCVCRRNEEYAYSENETCDQSRKLNLNVEVRIEQIQHSSWCS
eukprot:gb/GECG01000431.1/.p1 GENE.gb/GECG01000431.1/~~gb/GECG01000431.1/.p1  ORF type:complete len:129 (+),score=15.34 gb/GECG01000431.1/:1-387(+)